MSHLTIAPSGTHLMNGETSFPPFALDADGEQGLLADAGGGRFRLATSADRDPVVLYPPHCGDADVPLGLPGHRRSGWNLAERAPLTVDAVGHDGRTRFRRLAGRFDQLVIAERRP